MFLTRVHCKDPARAPKRAPARRHGDGSGGPCVEPSNPERGARRRQALWLREVRAGLPRSDSERPQRRRAVRRRKAHRSLSVAGLAYVAIAPLDGDGRAGDAEDMLSPQKNVAAQVFTLGVRLAHPARTSRAGRRS